MANRTRIKETGIIVITIICLCLNVSKQKQILIDYSSWGSEASLLFSYYYNITNGTYIDIGSYDPIQISNTLNLYVRGWNGINIQANVQRLRQFYIHRHHDINLNYAISQQSNKYITLYQTQKGIDSTISQNVKNYFKNQKNISIAKQIKVPSITLAQLCQQYYTHKPTFINIDIQGYQGKVLQGNNWDNQLCRPQLIISQYVNASQKSKLVIPKDVLSKHNYTLLEHKVGNNQVYIANQVVDKYKVNYQQGKKMLDQMTIIKFPQIRKILQQKFNVTQKYRYNKQKNRHYNRKNSPLYYHFARNNTPVYIDQILQDSNKTQNKSIFIFNFNQSSSHLLLNNYGLTYRDHVKFGQYQFWQLDIKQFTKRQYKDPSYIIYVFKHKITQQNQLQILPMRYIKQKVGNIQFFIDYYKDVQWFNQRQKKLGRVPEITYHDAPDQWAKLEYAILVFMFIICIIITLCLFLRSCGKHMRQVNNYQFAEENAGENSGTIN